MPALRFAIFGNVYQPRKSSSVQKLLGLLEQHRAKVMIESGFYAYLHDKLRIALPEGVAAFEGSDFDADVAVSMGGDGTFLETARRVANKQIPILGVNMGRMGFLADVTPDELETVVTQLCSGRLSTEERCVLQLEYDRGEPEGYPYALNEVAVLKRDMSAMIGIRVEINGEYLTTYQADGLIVNTPTGSTGYALSVGGPIMQPGSRTLGLVPVAPHSLTVRPITVTDDAVVRLTVNSRSHQFLVSLDGRSEKCSEDVRLTIRRAPYYVKVLKRPGQSFFRTIRNKLMWGADSRE